MSWTQTQQQCGPSVVIRARRQATMWSGCLVLERHQHTKISLVMGLSDIVPYHWVQCWTMKWAWAVLILSKWVSECKKRGKNKLCYDCMQFKVCSKSSINCMIMTLSILHEWQEGSPRGLPWWHSDNNAGPIAGSRSVRQTVTPQASGLFGKPCWIEHFVCGIRAGAKPLHLLIPQLPACQRPDKAQWCGAAIIMYTGEAEWN